MPRINIYEHSETYSYQTKNNSYATIAFPIAAIWGPTYVEGDEDSNPDWVHFSSGYRGTTDFMQTFRGANTYLGSREKSFDYALKLLASGYDILVKRVDGLGAKAYANKFIIPEGGTQPTPAATNLVLYPASNSTTYEYGDMPYRLYLPYVAGGAIVWRYPVGTESDATEMKYKVTHSQYDAAANKWVPATNSNKFRITAKVATQSSYIVTFSKPNVITTEVSNYEDATVTIDNIEGRQKQVKLTGTVTVSVFTDDGALLERRNITLTEVSTYNPTAGDDGTNASITITSVLSPEFTYIQIHEIPAMLTLKATTTPSDSYVFASTAAVSSYGLFTFELGKADDFESAVPATSTVYLKGNGSGSGSVAAIIAANTQTFNISAKYPGSFGNNLKVRVKCGMNADGFKIGTVEVFDNNGYNDHPNEIVSTDQLLELVPVAFDEDAATDSRPLITEATFSNLSTPVFAEYSGTTELSPSAYPVGVEVVSLLRGTDYATKLGTSDITKADILEIVAQRFDTQSSYYNYMESILTNADKDFLVRTYNQQMLYSRFAKCVGELTDPISYDWDALVQGIADDQYVPKSYIDNTPTFTMEYAVSTLVTKMVEVAANSKCGAALIGTPFGMPRGIQTGSGAYTVKTGALKYKDMVSQAVGPTYSTFGEVVGPWCKTTLALSGANSWIAPEIAHLLLIINAKGVGGMNKWWMVPAGMLGTGVVHTPEYKIKKKYLDLIQDHDEGVCLNPLMEVPGKGFTCFGNSTLWDKPLGTYNALQNLSTRFLTNRVKQRIWDTALQILFRYNNEDAYSHFYAGLSPLLDEMRSVGALVGNEYNPWGYRIIMNPDIINLDRINANTVIGKVELAVAGVIDTVDVDLFLLPPTGFQETYD
jgi:hypothetical protein